MKESLFLRHFHIRVSSLGRIRSRAFGAKNSRAESMWTNARREIIVYVLFGSLGTHYVVSVRLNSRIYFLRFRRTALDWVQYPYSMAVTRSDYVVAFLTYIVRLVSALSPNLESYW